MGYPLDPQCHWLIRLACGIGGIASSSVLSGGGVGGGGGARIWGVYVIFMCP